MQFEIFKAVLEVNGQRMKFFSFTASTAIAPQAHLTTSYASAEPNGTVCVQAPDDAKRVDDQPREGLSWTHDGFRLTVPLSTVVDWAEKGVCGLSVVSSAPTQ